MLNWTSMLRGPLRVWSLAVLLVAALLIVTLPTTPRAVADTAPPAASVPATVSSDALPTAQIDGVAWSQVVVGTKVYVGGSFTTARPAGAAAGVTTVPRSNLLAYDITTGELLPGFAPVVNGQVRGMAASPDGSRLYVVGQFTAVDGVARNRVAAFDTATGALITSFAPNANSTVYGVTATATTVYLGGAFSTLDNVARSGAAAVSADTGVLTGWVPAPAGGNIRQLIVSPDLTKVVLGGAFTTMNGSGSPGYGLAMVDATTGALLPLPINSLIRDAGVNASIMSLAATPAGFYGTGYSFQKTMGNLEGAFKADWDGNLVWVEDCHGDTYSVFPVGGTVYVTGHAHYCGNVGGFPQTTPDWTYQRAIAFSDTVGGTVANDQYGYFNYEGQPRPTLLNWFPDLNTGTYTGQGQAAWSVAGNSDYVVLGGEFTQVNQKGQQGLVRFAKTSIAPNTDGPRLTGPDFVPTVRTFAQGVRISWPANYDRDNEQLTYRLVKNSNTSSPIYTTTVRSTFWQRPVISYFDKGATAGSTYRLIVRDPLGNSRSGDTVTVPAGSGAVLSPYEKAVTADSPQYFWPLNEATGTTAADDYAGGEPTTIGSTVVGGVPGALAKDTTTAMRFAGTASTASVSSQTLRSGAKVFTEEAWFKTSSTNGGKIIGWGTRPSGDSANTDRMIYLGRTGKLYFGVYPAAYKTVSSTTAYNDGQWHHVAASLGADGMKLYADGALIAARTDVTTAQINNGYWRIGDDYLAGWPDNPSLTKYFAGDIDNAAVYNYVLTPAQIAAHRSATNAAPSATFSASTSQLTTSLDATGSSDSDGYVADYAWDFGDGTTGTGSSPSHTFGAAGSYPVKLTVTDENGGAASTTKTVTTTAGDTPFVSDPFDRTAASGLGSADTGGAWTVSAASGFAVGSGSGLWKLPTAGTTRTAYLGSTTRDSTDLTLDLSSDVIANGGGTYLSVLGRRVSATADYRTNVRLTGTNKVTVGLAALQGSSTSTSLSSTVTLPGTLAAGDQVHVRMQTFGTGTTTVRAKVWLGSDTEPTGWTVSATDAYAGLQAPGSVGLTAYLSGSTTNVPVTIGVQQLTARPVS